MHEIDNILIISIIARLALVSPEYFFGCGYENRGFLVGTLFLRQHRLEFFLVKTQGSSSRKRQIQVTESEKKSVCELGIKLLTFGIGLYGCKIQLLTIVVKDKIAIAMKIDSRVTPLS